MLKSLRLGVAAAIGGAIMTLGSGVFATDYRRPGVSCREANDNILYTGGNAVNPSGQTDATFQCPMHRRNSVSDLPIELIFVSVDDQAFHERIECFARSCDRYGDSCNSTTLAHTGAWGQNDGTLSLLSADADPEGFVFLNCIVPDVDEQDGGSSGVLSYRWRD